MKIFEISFAGVSGWLAIATMKEQQSSRPPLERMMSIHARLKAGRFPKLPQNRGRT
jgi:hypothetical protein